MERDRRWTRVGRRAAPYLALGGLLLLAGGAAPAREARPRPVVVAPADVPAALAEWRRGGEGARRIQVLDAGLAERIRLLRQDAPTFDRAWARLERSGVPLVIGTGAQLSGVLPGNVRDSRGWAGVTVAWDGDDGALLRSAIAIRVRWLDELHRSYGNPRSAFLAELDRLLIHEVYGHLVPVVEARSSRHVCADPRPGQLLADSCAGRREIELRAERRRVATAPSLPDAALGAR